jgi:ABC-2 type transport system permease protein
MKGWFAVFHKEMSHFFVSPIAYIVIACFVAIAGGCFTVFMHILSRASYAYASMPNVAEGINMTDVVVRRLIPLMEIVLLFAMPFLTMRLFAEEKRSGCFEMLLTYPLSDIGVIAGKFLATLVLLVIMLAATFPLVLLMYALGNPDPGPLVGGYIGLVLMAAAFTALGLFISSLTESQIVSAAVAFGAALLFWILSAAAQLTGPTTGAVIEQLSILGHLESFNKGIVSLSDLSFFILFTAFFLFLTLRSVETYRWRG